MALEKLLGPLWEGVEVCGGMKPSFAKDVDQLHNSRGLAGAEGNDSRFLKTRESGWQIGLC